MISKKFSILIIIIISISTVICCDRSATASHYFRKFEINDYPRDQLAKEELIDQVRDFSINILKELEQCKSRGERDKQDYYCTNIYEADRIRIGLLLAINAHLPDNINSQNTAVSRLIFKKNSFSSLSNSGNLTINHSDTDNQNPQANNIQRTLVQNSDIQALTSNSNYHFFIKTTALGLRSCALGIGSSTKDRFTSLNSNPSANNSTTLREYPPIGCNDLIEVIKQFANQNSLTTILDATSDFVWLNFNASEKANIKSSSDERSYYNNLKNTGQNYINAKSECAISGLSALILCPSMRFLGGTSQAGLDVIKNKLLLNPNLINTSSASGQVLFRTWQEFQMISNILLLICLILVIIAYLVNFKIDTYQLKKNLPKLIGLAILSNLSFWLIRIGMDISNLIGQGLYTIFLKLAGSSIDIMSITAGVLSGSLGVVLTGVVVAAGFYFGGIVALVPILLLTAFSILAVVFSLAFRDGAFILTVIVAPLAIASLLLPKTERLFKVWKITISTIFMIPIVVGFCFGAGMLASSLMFRSGGFMTILSFIPLSMQIFIFPKLLINSVKNLPLVGDKLSQYLTTSSTLVSQKYQETDFHKTALHNYQLKRAKQREKALFNKKDPRTYLNPTRRFIRDKSRHAIDRILPGYNTVVSAPSFDPETFQQITDTASDFNPVMARLFLFKKGLLNDSNGNLAREFNGLDFNIKNQINSLLNSNNPNDILSALINISDDGNGDVTMVFKGLNEYIRQGGERDYIDKTLRKIEANFSKEAMFTDAAQIDQAIKGINSASASAIDYNTLKITNKDSLVNITAEYMETVTNWTKFKGFANNSINDLAFSQLLQSQGINRQLIFDAIKKQAGQQQKATEYLKKFS